MIFLSNGLHNIQHTKSVWCIQWNFPVFCVITCIIFYSFIFLLIYLFILLFNLTWLHFMSKSKVTRPTYVAFVPTPSVVTFTDVGWRGMWKTYAIKAAVFITDICRKDKKIYYKMPHIYAIFRLIQRSMQLILIT